MNSNNEVWTGKDKLFENVWCIKDIGTSEYKRLAKISQTATPWVSNIQYGHNMVYFCVVVIALFILKNLIYLRQDRLKGGSKADSIFGSIYYKIAAINRWISYRRIPSFLCEIFQLPSSMGNFLLISAGLVYMLCYAFIPKPWYRGCRGFGSPPLSIRAGLQSTALLPFIFMLSGKVNIISQVTDISYEKINVYHRWLSIICCFLGWVHTIPFYIQSVQEGGRERLAYMERTNKYFYNGIPPILFLTILTIFSHSALRARFYEFWLQIHWICAIGMYISLFIHIDNSLQSWKYMAATVVFWVVQLMWRALSKGMFKPNKYGMTNKCKMRKYASNSDKDHYFEILIENSDDLRWEPGQHIFLRIPGVRVLESHPFSIVSSYEPSEETHLKFIVKTGGLGGLTRYLYDKLPDIGYTDFDVMVDGPYGGSQRKTQRFDSVYLLASGTGISAVLPFLYESCKKFNSTESITKAVSFDWIVKTSDNVEWILPELQKIVNMNEDLIRSKMININIYISESVESSNTEFLDMLNTHVVSESESSESKNNAEIEKTGLVNISNLKPDIKSLVENYRESLQAKNIFILSGSESMKVQASNAIAGLQCEVFNSKKTVNEIYLHSETFGW